MKPSNENPLPDYSNIISVLGCDGYETYAENNKIFVRPKWIKCSDKLPGKYETVLCFSKKEGIYTARLQMDTWFCYCNCLDGSSVYDVTHWMPLPELPKE